MSANNVNSAVSPSRSNALAVLRTGRRVDPHNSDE